MNWSVELRDSAGTRFNGNIQRRVCGAAFPHELYHESAPLPLLTARRTELAISMQILFMPTRLCPPGFTHPGRFNEPQGQREHQGSLAPELGSSSFTSVHRTKEGRPGAKEVLGCTAVPSPGFRSSFGNDCLNSFP